MGAVGIAVWPVPGGWWVVVQAACVAALIVAVAIRRPVPLLAWSLLGIAPAASALAISGVPARLGDQVLPNSASWWGHAVTSTSACLALVSLASQRRPRSLGGILHGTIIVIGVTLASWVLVLDPLFDSRRLHDAAGRHAAVFAAFDLALLLLGLRIAIMDRPRVRAHLLLAGALAALVLGEGTAVAATAMRAAPAGPAVRAAWFLACGLGAAAVLHPSSTGPLAPALASMAPYRRLAWYLALTMLGPVAWIADVINHGGLGDPHSWAAVPGILSAVLLVLIVARLQIATREYESMCRKLAFRDQHDALTGLANRDLFRLRLDEVLAGARERPVGLLLIDLDGFKDVNDTHGHQLGDELLVAVAQRLREMTEQDDTLARLGSDEFAIITTCEAELFATRAVAALAVPYRIGDQDLHITASIGVHVADAPTAASIALQNADLALYAAKATGRDRTVRYRPALREAHAAHNRLAERLHEAVENNRFALHYQPVVELETGRVTAVEALLRWQTPDGKSIAPTIFVPAAEEIGLIGRLGAWVLERACTDARRWYDRYGLSVTVNVSGQQLRDPHFADEVLATLRRTGLPGTALVLEITETVLVTATMDETAQVSRRLARLRAHGLRIAIDDFGTGYSSLTYLRSLPVDVIKIDRSFVDQAGTGAVPSAPDRALLRALLEITASLYMQPVAEGVETVEQASMLRELGCSYVQGFLFARPSPAAEIDKLLGNMAAANLRRAA